jgi:hypothetical protein
MTHQPQGGYHSAVMMSFKLLLLLLLLLNLCRCRV